METLCLLVMLLSLPWMALFWIYSLNTMIISTAVLDCNLSIVKIDSVSKTKMPHISIINARKRNRGSVPSTWQLTLHFAAVNCRTKLPLYSKYNIKSVIKALADFTLSHVLWTCNIITRVKQNHTRHERQTLKARNKIIRTTVRKAQTAIRKSTICSKQFIT